MSVTDGPDVAEPPRPTAGVDWASEDHAVSVVDHDGEQISRFPVAHNAVGLRALVRRLLAPGWARSGSNGPTARSSTPCAAPGWSSTSSHRAS